MKKLALLLTALLLAMISAGCGDAASDNSSVDTPTALSAQSAVSFTLDENNKYTGFDNLPINYTPDQAVADGCFVVISGSGLNDRSTLYGGGETWDEFLSFCNNGQEASLRKVLFIDSTPYYADLFYSGGEYHYFDCEDADLTDRPFQYLRCLTGLDGNPEKECTAYVLTDSLELTYHDVMWSFLSSDLRDVTDIPFEWLGFVLYLDNSDDAYSDYTDITPDGITDVTVLKDGTDCESVVYLDSEYYPIGCGFGGLGVCDIKLYKTDGSSYLLFTYSWGSGLHRSQIGVFDLNSKETVFTSEAFLNMDIMLSDGADGSFDVYQADVSIGEDFCDLSLTQGEKIAALKIDGGGIRCEWISESAVQYSEEQLLAMVNEIMQPTEDEPDLLLSSNPYDYINAHIETYSELVVGGQSVADFFVQQLQGADTFGLDKYIMAAVCSDITGVGANKCDDPWSTAEEWLALYSEKEE